MSATEVFAEFIRSGACFGVGVVGRGGGSVFFPGVCGKPIRGPDQGSVSGLGLLEFNFEQRPEWYCTNVIAQVHRLVDVPEVRRE